MGHGNSLSRIVQTLFFATAAHWASHSALAERDYSQDQPEEPVPITDKAKSLPKMKVEAIQPYLDAGFFEYDARHLSEKGVPVSFAERFRVLFGSQDIVWMYSPFFGPGNVSSVHSRDIKDKMEYFDFSKLEIADSEPVPVPYDIARRILAKAVSLRPEPEKFRKMVFGAAEKLGYGEDELGGLDAKVSIMLAVDIVAGRMEPFNVDFDNDFLKKYGEHLSYYGYFEIGKGDCDKYSTTTIAVFNMFREINPRLSNVYMCDQVGGQMPHSWNSVLVIEKDRIKVSYIDPIFYDNGEGLEASEFHLDKDRFMESFYQY